MNELKKLAQEMRDLIPDLGSEHDGAGWLSDDFNDWVARLSELSQTHVLVPRVPTVKMNSAGLGAGFPHEVWDAMIRAAEGGE